MEEPEKIVFGAEGKQDLGGKIMERAKRSTAGRDQGAVVEGEAEEVHDREHPFTVDQEEGA